MSAKTTTTFLLLAAALSACAAEYDLGSDRRNVDDVTGGEAEGEPGDPTDPAVCAKGKEYLGFGDKNLIADRRVVKLGVDRGRIKPFSALRTEYTRVLGAEPASLAASAATFGEAQARWYEEPEANAVALQTAYAVAFDGCLSYIGTDPAMAVAPDAATAGAQCAAMARKFWSKTPSPDEIEACVDVATRASATDATPQRRWAYACASVLTAAGFMTY